MDAQALLGIGCVVHTQVGLAWLQCPYDLSTQSLQTTVIW